ncbi:hypothetical protein [Humisphaera borealis]|uniref:Uncharacterized protein n=1 Tax=Humisphaera borealis TaxID=2807512 RepID=A0A7M2X0I1_9BACT|nr:hypothetical protein [Humisphaera borealis]QOV90601.1 hypothetical protein IPV69_04345 [Humisphaera borealis]
MRPILIIVFTTFTAIVASTATAGLSQQDAEARLRMAMQIARERNDKSLVAEVEALAQSFKSALPADSDGRLRDLEKKVGIDPGGWSMAGQPLARPTPAMAEQSRVLAVKLSDAMKSDDPARVRAVTADMLAVLGDQAGVPDGRRVGVRVDPKPMPEADATRLFLAAIASEGRAVEQLSAGRPLPDQMLRFYGYLLDATTTVRPAIARHAPDELPRLDKLAGGSAQILLGLQQADGHFPFPDLRGRNIRFGEMIDRQIGAGTIEIRDGWVVTADPDGGTQFDTGVCGVALIAAGQLHKNDAWTKAGLRAADWAIAQHCCGNFNYNAFSVSLLSHAYRASGEAKYRDAAVRKFRVGVAPGQAPNGRWLDAHNARTVYHVIILRALGDLAAALPPDRKAERAELDAVARPAIKATLDEFDAAGVTVEALPELQSLRAAWPGDARLNKAIDQMAAMIVGKCTDGRRVRMGSQPHQLAGVVIPGSLAITVP